MNNQATPVQHAPYLLPLQAAAYGLNGFNTSGLVSLGSHPTLGAGVMGAGQLGKLAGLPQGVQGAYPGLTAVSLATGTNMGQLHGLQVASAMGQLPAGVMSQLAAGQLPPLSGLGPHQGSLYSPMMSPGALGPYTGVPGSHGLPQVLGPNGMTNMPKLFVPSVKVGVIIVRIHDHHLDRPLLNVTSLLSSETLSPFLSHRLSLCILHDKLLLFLNLCKI